MEIPLIILLVIYFVFLAVYVAFLIFMLYHMVRYAFASAVAATATILFVGVTVFLLAYSGYWITQVDWSDAISFGTSSVPELI